MLFLPGVKFLAQILHKKLSLAKFAKNVDDKNKRTLSRATRK
jgi:hypothetical protein